MKRNYYLFNPGRMSRKDNTLKFTPINEDGKEDKPRYLPIENVEQLYFFGSVDANSSLYNFLGKNDVSAHFFDYYENYTGSFMPRNSLLSGKMLLHQVKHHLQTDKRLTIARLFVEGAGYNILKNLKYYDNRGKNLEPIITEVETYKEFSKGALAVDELMGIEGNMRKWYYEAFSLILNHQQMDGRSKQPPLNPVNALISFGNMMCYSQVLRSIHQTQLDPTISYLHSPGERRFSLALDIAEIFKPLLVDRVIFKVLNKRMLTEKDFDQTLNRVLLKEKGKQVFIQAFEDRLKETIQHRTLNRAVSYKHLIKLECYKLQKHLLGIEGYKPFKIWW